MKLFVLVIATLLFPLSRALAHEEAETANLDKADWAGPLIAIIVIIGAIIIARVIRVRSKKL